MLALLSCLALTGCQAPTAMAPIESPSLPTELAEAYKASFKQNPEITARRFLMAYDSFALSGPVTQPRVLDFTRMQDGLERGRLLGYVLALDLNGDAQITQTEYHTFSSFQKGPNKILGLDDLFLTDENQDQIISLQEAILYGRKLHDRAATHDMRQIESYLMLFDVNSDGVVTRSEMKARLFSLYSRPLEGSAKQAVGLRRASPN